MSNKSNIVEIEQVLEGGVEAGEVTAGVDGGAKVVRNEEKEVEVAGEKKEGEVGGKKEGEKPLGRGLVVFYDGSNDEEGNKLAGPTMISGQRTDSSASYEGSSSTSSNWTFARPTSTAIQRRRQHLNKIGGAPLDCQPSTSSAPPQIEEPVDEKENDGSMMSSLHFDDSDHEWERMPANPSNDRLRAVTRRPSLIYNMPFMTEQQAFKFWRPTDLFDTSDAFSSSASDSTNSEEAQYWEGFRRHEERKRKKRDFVALSFEERRALYAQELRKRSLMKRGYEMVSQRPYEDLDYIRRLPKRRRVGSSSLAKDEWDVEEEEIRKIQDPVVVVEEAEEGSNFEEMRTQLYAELAQARLEMEEAGFVFRDFGSPPIRMVEAPLSDEPVGQVEDEEVVVDVVLEEAPMEEVDEQRPVELVVAEVAEQRVVEEVAVDDGDLMEVGVAAEEEVVSDEEMPMLDVSVDSDDDLSSVSSTATAIPLRRSQRLRKPIERWGYPVDHIRRRRVARRNAHAQPARPVRRRPMMLPPPPPPVVVKQPRLPPFLSRGAPQLPNPAAPTAVAVSFKTVRFEELPGELAECRQKAAAADFGFAQLDLEISIARIESSIANLMKKNAVPSPTQQKRLLNSLAKVRASLGMV